MKKILLILVILFQSSCASGFEIRIQKKHSKIDKEFQPYIDDFIKVSKGKVKKSDMYNLSMGLYDYPKGQEQVLGTCHIGANEIDINKKWWSGYATLSERTELIFHELGHCILKRGHTIKPPIYREGFIVWLERVGFKLGIFKEKGYLYDGCPASMMHPEVFSDFCINKHWNYYVNELFNNLESVNFVELRATQNIVRCSIAAIINKTQTWTKIDNDTFNRAGVRCIQLYQTCLKTFYKNNNHHYSAICE